MEGPQFSTLAESHLYRSWGADVIGMTNLQEAKLAREAEICYATMALVTDYDCWHETEEAVSGEAVMEVVRQNVKMSQEVVRQALQRAGALTERSCPCAEALKFSLITERSMIPQETLENLKPIVGKYL
jgi:5'-methylthioadenosine phosphorylase